MVCVDSGFFCYLLWYCFWVIVEIAENVVGIGYILAIFGVVPCVGTWIEINTCPMTSLAGIVVPCVGTWIEICSNRYLLLIPHRRPLRGDVD